MNEHQKQTEFLRQCILYGDTAEHHPLEERIVQLQRDERCLRRALWLMALLAALALAGLCYAAIFLTVDPQTISRFMTQLIGQALCALGLGSMTCLLAFMGLGVIYRKELDKRREECRRVATKILESRLGQPRALNRTEQETPAPDNSRVSTLKTTSPSS